MGDKPINDLITRLEVAKGSDRGLDAEIAVACGAATGFLERFGKRDEGWVSKGPHHAVVPAPLYTASIDAALTLVPEGIWWKVSYYDSAVGDYGAIGKSPAIALCIAALKARRIKMAA